MEMRKVLLTRFPLAFKGFGEPKTPLKVGVREEILAATPDLNPVIVKAALRDYCRGPTYHRNVIPGATRIDLDGNPAGIVTEQETHFHTRHLARISAFKAKRGEPPRRRKGGETA